MSVDDVMRRIESSGLRKIFSPVLKGIGLSLGSAISLLTDLHRTVEYTRQARFDFKARPDDIFIVTYPRSGTTWMQMILYQLATDGRMDFPHISTVMPWFERSLAWHTMSIKDFDAMPSPRMFKSHLHYKDIPSGECRFIYVWRDGKDVAASYFHLYRTQLAFRGTFDEFFQKFVNGKLLYESWFDHVSGWWEHRDDPNILFLRYEDMLRDLEGCVRRIADFLHIDAGDRLPEIVERCGFEFMKKHEDRFDPITEKIMEQGYVRNEFLRKGKSGDGKQHLTATQENVYKRELEKYGTKLPGIDRD